MNQIDNFVQWVLKILWNLAQDILASEKANPNSISIPLIKRKHINWLWSPVQTSGNKQVLCKLLLCSSVHLWALSMNSSLCIVSCRIRSVGHTFQYFSSIPNPLLKSCNCKCISVFITDTFLVITNIIDTINYSLIWIMWNYYLFIICLLLGQKGCFFWRL